MLSNATSTARLAVLAFFFLNGVGFAGWVVRIPAIAGRLEIGEGVLGLALLGAAAGAIVAMPATGWLTARFGSRRVVGVSAVAFALALVLPPLSSSAAWLALALVAVGAANGTLDVSMNAQAVAVEKIYHRPIMSSFHAFFSLGGMAGAVIGGLMATLGVGVTAHLSGVAAVMALCFVVAYRGLLPSSADASNGGPTFARPSRELVGLGVISFCVLLGEGAMADWSAVYLSGDLGTTEGFAAAGYAAFSLAMAAGRLIGDRLALALGAVPLVRLGAIISTVGLGLSLVSGVPAVAVAGFAAAGAGFSIIFPNALSAAGRSCNTATGPAIAAVSTAGYFGFLAGPPSIGLVAHLVSLGAALYIVVGLAALIILLAHNVHRAGK